jgi:hypothetical protein
VKIYLKTRSGKWMIINRKLEHVVIRGKKKSTRYILAGETTDPPSYTTTIRELELPATHVTKLISALLDKKREKLVVVIEPKSSTLYSVKVTEGDASIIDAIVEEITAKSKKKTSAKTSEESRE